MILLNGGCMYCVDRDRYICIYIYIYIYLYFNIKSHISYIYIYCLRIYSTVIFVGNRYTHAHNDVSILLYVNNI